MEIYIWFLTITSLSLSFTGQFLSLCAYVSEKSRFEDYFVFMAAILYTAFFTIKLVDLLIEDNLSGIREPILTLAVWYFMLFVIKQYKFKTKLWERLANIFSALLMATFVFILVVFLSFPSLERTRELTEIQSFFFSSNMTVDFLCLLTEFVCFLVSVIFCYVLKKDLLRIAIEMLIADCLLRISHLILFFGKNIVFSTINNIVSMSAQIVLIFAMIDYYRARTSKRSS